MRPFAFSRAADIPTAVAATAQPGTALIAGGTELVNWMKEGIVVPTRLVALVDFYQLPGNAPERDSVLHAGEIIAAIEVPASPLAKRSHYLKVRERASYEFALVSAAVALELDGKRIRQAHIALGGVAPKPWRLTRAEDALAGGALETSAPRTAL